MSADRRPRRSRTPPANDPPAACLATRLVRRESVGTASPQAYRALFTETFGPVVATYASLADDPARLAALARDFLDFAERTNRGRPGGPADEYLLTVARPGSA